ncbi:hypothetical protein [Acinetobacter higginsii]|uniref:hypothetical protein n=1 Tax=Acinetobacter higginsii TaxID=70347 RepID=UPI001F606E99|nr:hypothetical protein [Acinetobacter higginsii]MCI3881228.1 hypothetical protein [Acinetobacter higginsii]
MKFIKDGPHSIKTESAAGSAKIVFTVQDGNIVYLVFFTRFNNGFNDFPDSQWSNLDDALSEIAINFAT